MQSLCRRTGTSAELIFFDLDGFKEVNDELGHKAGDEILQSILMKCFRTADVIARLGGDEFVVLMTASDPQSDAALARLDKLAAADCDVLSRLSWSAGRIGFDPERHTSIQSLLADADSKMYEDKVQRRKTGS